MIITLGLTYTDRPDNYVPAMDGFDAGRVRQQVRLDVPDEVATAFPEYVTCEALFVATNAPDEVIAVHPLAAVYDAIIGDGRTRWRALSIGDTVSFGPVNHWALDRVPGYGTRWVQVTRL